jgi:RNA polymerase sigma-70 factor, ECF subfamily
MDTVAVAVSDLRRQENRGVPIRRGAGTDPSAETICAAASVAEGGVSPDASLEAEFELLLLECPTLPYRVALGVLRNAAEAEDVAQEAILRAYRNFHRLRDHARFRAWLVRTTWRLSLDRIRSAGRRERRERAVMEERCEAGVESVAAGRELERRLADALDALSEKLRLVMVLAAIEGYNTREVAKLAGVPEGTVKSRLHLARKQLAEALRDMRSPGRAKALAGPKGAG